MRVAIIEICEKSHYMVTNALIKTYLSDAENTVAVYATSEICNLLSAQAPASGKLIYNELNNDTDISSFLNSVNQFIPERIHFATVSKYFKAFYNYTPPDNCRIFFHFHNIDLWFKPALFIQISRLKEVFSDGIKNVDISRQIKYSLKDILMDFYRKRLIRKILRERAALIILSEAQRYHLGKFTDSSGAIVFPSLIFEPDLYTDFEPADNRIRLCIPGSVAQGRREYIRLFEIFEQNNDFYKSNFTIDLLGFIPPVEKKLLEKILELEASGLKILYYRHFIDVNEFDQNLYRSDILLSNIYLADGKGMQNKETATVYHMIRGAKPGIFPESFILDDDFRECVIKFKDYDHLHMVLKELCGNRQLLKQLKSNARLVSEKYTPSRLLLRLSK